jgi:capsular polysaccharide transport system permease protein
MRRESAIAVQGRVLFALIMREMTTRYGRNIGGYIWALLEPAATIALLAVIFQFISRHPALGGNFPIFFATGYMAFHIYLDISRAVSNAVTANKTLLTFPRVTIIDTVLARFILQLLTTIFVGTTILGGLLMVFDEPIILRFEAITLSIALAAAFGLAMGLFNCITFAWSKTWQTVFGLLNRPTFIISGIFFIYEDLPRFAQDIVWWNPLIHVTALMRKGFYPTYEASFVSPVYVILCATVLFMLGVMLMRTMRRTLLEA